MNSLEESDAAAASVAVAPRVKLADIEAAIAAEYAMTADKAVGAGVPIAPALKLLSLHVLVLKTGSRSSGRARRRRPRTSMPISAVSLPERMPSGRSGP